MEDQKMTKESLLRSKAKMIADRNERFAIIEQEIEILKEEIIDRLTLLTKKIEKAIGS